MKKQRMPKGWTQTEIRELAQRHDRMTEDEQVAEIEAAFHADDTILMAVPKKLVPKVLDLIKRSGRTA
jgi:predicted dinucleotide-binding enzyme